MLSEVLWAGAQKVLAQALKADGTELLATYAEQRDEQGRALIVRNGHHPARAIQTGIGPVTVQIPKVRSRRGELATFQLALVASYVGKTRSLGAAIPWLYLNGISMGEMQTALEGSEGKGLSARAVVRLKQTWREEYEGWQ